MNENGLADFSSPEAIERTARVMARIAEALGERFPGAVEKLPESREWLKPYREVGLIPEDMTDREGLLMALSFREMVEATPLAKQAMSEVMQ